MISLKGRRILITGGAGFIGHNMALAFKKEGAEVYVADSLSVNNLLTLYGQYAHSKENVVYYRKFIQERLSLLESHGIPLFVQDLRDYANLVQLMNSIRPQTVVHLAAVAHANKSNKSPFSTFDHSSRTLENVLDASRGLIDHFVYFSSSMVYGNFPEGMVTEETECNPLGIYGSLKLGGEKLVISYNQVFNLPYTIIRPSALYGERCISRRVGQIFLENAWNGRGLKIDGDGKEKLDFTYVQDLIQGVKKVIQVEKSRGEIFNITYGQSRSLNEIAEIICDNFPGLSKEFVPRDKLMPLRGTLSVEKAKSLLGYQPKFSIEKGFQKYIDWYKSMKTEAS